MRLLVLFVVVPLCELYLLLKLAEVTSGAFTFALVVITGIVGASLARWQGYGVVARLQDELRRGEMPAATVIDALMIFVAGALLLTPGILTDLFGFSLLIPVCRRLYRKGLLRWLRDHATLVKTTHWRASECDDSNTVDAEVVGRDDQGPKYDRIEGGGPAG